MKVRKGETRKACIERELHILRFRRRITIDQAKAERLDREIKHLESIKDHVDPGTEYVRAAKFKSTNMK